MVTVMDVVSQVKSCDDEANAVILPVWIFGGGTYTWLCAKDGSLLFKRPFQVGPLSALPLPAADDTDRGTRMKPRIKASFNHWSIGQALVATGHAGKSRRP